MTGPFFSLLLALGASTLVHSAEPQAEATETTSLPKVTVTENRLQTFGFNVIVEATLKPNYPHVTEVLPNTAASRAGLRPGDRILKSDGKSAAVTVFSVTSWYPKDRGGRTTLSAKKGEEAAITGAPSVVWTLEVETFGVKAPRTLKLVLPTPSPRWGAAKWQPPEGRAPAKVVETGPLAERCREVLDNGIWSFPGNGARLLVSDPDPARFHLLGYHWEITAGGMEHGIFVTQQRGRTEVLLTTFKDGEVNIYLTSPAATLEKSTFWGGPKAKSKQAAIERHHAGFKSEVDFWLTKVGRVTGQWPFELLPENSK